MCKVGKRYSCCWVPSVAWSDLSPPQMHPQPPAPPSPPSALKLSAEDMSSQHETAGWERLALVSLRLGFWHAARSLSLSEQLFSYDTSWYSKVFPWNKIKFQHSSINTVDLVLTQLIQQGPEYRLLWGFPPPIYLIFGSITINMG